MAQPVTDEVQLSRHGIGADSGASRNTTVSDHFSVNEIVQRLKVLRNAPDRGFRELRIGRVDVVNMNTVGSSAQQLKKGTTDDSPTLKILDGGDFSKDTGVLWRGLKLLLLCRW